MKIILLLASLSFTANGVSVAQTADRDSILWIFDRKDVATYGTIGWNAAALAMEFQWWWKDDYFYKQHEFRLQNDGYFYNSSYGVDKLGHMYSSYLIFHLTYDVMKWANFDDETALWSAIAVPASHALAIELGDGFSKWAFNPSDLYFNSAGLLFGVLQVHYPLLQRFSYKWSYYPSSGGGKNDPDWGPASDYSGHIYWLSVDLYNILPDAMQAYWTPYLNLAVGMGASNVSFGDTGTKRHEFYIGLDWNTDALFPGWGLARNLINKFKFPAPGIKFTPGARTVASPLLLE